MTTALATSQGQNAPGCPSGWSDLIGQLVTDSYNYERQCVRSDGNFQVVYLDRSTGQGHTPQCPSGWSDAVGEQVVYRGGAPQYRRICVRQL